MTAGDWISVLNLVFLVVMAGMVVPLRRAASRIHDLEAKLDKYNIDTINRKLDSQDARICHMEHAHNDCLRGLPERFVTKADLQRSEAHRDNQLGIISKQLDEIRLLGAAHTEALGTIKDQIKEVFKRLNDKS